MSPVALAILILVAVLLLLWAAREVSMRVEMRHLRPAQMRRRLRVAKRRMRRSLRRLRRPAPAEPRTGLLMPGLLAIAVAAAAALVILT